MNDINILFVDDEIFTLHSLERLLRKESYKMFFAESGEEALQIIVQNDIHIIVSDMKMPEMDGLTLLRAIKKNNPSIIRLVLSAYTYTAQLLPCINSGEVFRFITKPLEKEDLKTALNDAIQLHLIQRDNTFLVESLKKCNEQLSLALDENKTLERRLENLCGIDVQTSFFNKRQLYVTLEQEISKFQRYGNIFSALLIDFEKPQDSGHQHVPLHADYTVKDVALQLRTVLRKTDLPFRYSDQCFFVLLPETSPGQAKKIGWNILENFRNYFLLDNPNAEDHGPCIGVYSFDNTSESSVEDLLKSITENTLAAKQKGGYQVVSCIQG